MVMRSRRLEDLLGARLDDLSYHDIESLVGNPEAAEAEDLDYKRDHYESSDKGKEELAKDVAALANHRGGVLILGMAEAKGVPSLACGIDLDDHHLRRMRQVIANNTAPPVPFEPILVPKPNAAGTGFLLLAVPRSPQAPHAVTATPTKASRDVLRYPRRGGSQTEWLTETVVATAYRARYTAAAARNERLADVESDIVMAVVERTTPHLIVALVPEIPGEMTVNASTFEQYRVELLGADLYLGQGHRVFGYATVGARRLIAQESRGDHGARAELHRDGSAAIVLPLYTHQSKIRGDDVDLQFVELGEVVYQLLCALPFLAGHARDRAAASGTAMVRAVLVNDIGSHPDVSMHTAAEYRDPLPMTVDRLHSGVGRRLETSTQPCDYAYSEATVLLDDVADQGRGLLQAAAALADELLHAYGIPETGLITADGQLRTVGFTDRNRGALAVWAREHGLIDAT
ncbi:helix-turn-helix domain-containing protein [Streptomyces sp. NPDC127033]|uniref:AlbA family DNA-binding domain-containing protein n=1 Tax=Streptomyces sp. NPDC127033 TaxID=3347110 RepID=UPI00365407D8